MDSNNNENQQQKSNAVVDAAKQQGKQAIQKMAKEGIKKGAGKAAGHAAAGSATTGALAAIMPYLLIALLVILIIMIIIGIVAFLLTMPGMMQEKINQIFTDISTSIQSIYKGDVDATVTEDDVIELANYINGMEYDLIGYGFVQPDKDSSVKTIEQLRDEGYEFKEEPNPDKTDNDDGEPDKLIFLVDESGNKYNDKWYYTDGKKYGTDGKPYKETDGSYTRYEITYDSQNKVTKLPDATSDSSILRTYAMSERRLYVLRNDDSGFLESLATWLNEVLYGYSGAWAQGLLELFPAVNGRADEGRYNLWDSITDASKVEITGDNKLSVDVGWFNEPMKFELDGWSGRYGLSTDFLISLHLATLSPELVTTLVQNYDTRVQVYLDHITGATVTAYFHTENMKDAEGNPNYVSLETFKDFKQDSSWNLLDGWFLSKKEAKKIMKEFDIESLESGKYTCGGEDPSQVIYYSGKGSTRVAGECFTKTFDDIDWYDNVFKDQYFIDDNSFSSWEDALNIEVINSDNGETASNTDEDKYVTITKSTSIVEVEETAEEPNDNEEDLTDDSANEGTASVENVSVSMNSNNKDFRPSKLKNVLGMLDVYYKAINTSTDLNIVEFKSEQNCPLNFCNIFDPDSGNKQYFEKYLSYSQFRSMATDSDQYYECEVAVWKTNDDGRKEGEEDYDISKDGEIVLSLLIRRTSTDQNFDIAAIAYRNYSLAEMIENGFDPNEPSGHTPCSDTDSDATCSNCRRYISDIISALGKIQDDSYETYEPYIARVVGSWFRDTYFIVPESDDDATEIVYDEYGEKFYPDGSLTLGKVQIIQNDEGFLEATGELWTDYLYDDRGIDYALFVINPDGSYLNSDSDFETWKTYYPNLPDEIYNSIGVLQQDGNDYYGYINVYPDSNSADIPLDTDIELLFEENEVPFIKRARTNTLTTSGSASSTGGWSAYSYSENWSDEKVPIDVLDAPGKIQKVHEAYNFEKETPENIFYYSISAKNVVTQMEDGQRGITNEKVKYLFKNKKYYKYDGTTQTAFNIRDDWNEVLEIFADSDAMKQANIETTLKETARTAVRIALFGWAGLFNDYDENLDSARETVMDGYIDKVYYREDLSETSFDNFKFARDFDDDGIADLASENLKGESSYDDLEITEVTKFSNDPRNPELINNIDLTSESLAAFSILENTHTADADYAYRDFKELICELDYFDKEDLTEPAKDILEWILPESGSSGWPVRKYDKLNEFGSLIHSKEMYENLNSIMIQSVSGGEQVDETPSGGPEITGTQVANTNNISTNENPLGINYNELYSLARVSSRNTITTYIEPTDEVMYDDYYETGYTVVVKANGIQYKSYKQGSGAYYAGYAIPPFVADDPNDCMASDACGITSTAIVLSAYDVAEDPWELAQEVKDTYTYCFSDLAGIGRNHNIEFEPEVAVQYEEDIDSAAEKLKSAFNEGKPAIILVGAGGGYTTEGHYMVAIGVNSEEHLIIINCGNKDYAGFEDTGLTIEEFLSTNMVMANGNNAGRGFMIPVEAPTGFYVNNKIFEGFEKGQPVVSPATAKILEIGTVEVQNENTSSIMERFYVKTDDTVEETENEEQVIVTQAQYDAIESTAQTLESNSDSTFGKSYKTGYIKLEVIGKESLINIQEHCKDSNIDVTYLDHFLEEYGFKDNDNNGVDDDKKTICESFIIYIEGIELRYDQNGDWTFDNTIIKEIIKTKTNTTSETSESSTDETVSRGDMLGTDVNNMISLYNAGTATNQDYIIDNYTKREIPEYYPLGKRQELSTAEDRKAAGTAIIETVNDEIYLKAGTLIGLTGDANIKIIMKDQEGAVVENVEDYLEIEDGKSQTGLTSDLMNFYFLPYESGGSKIGTYNYGTCSTGECAIGIIQWTTLSTADGASSNLSGVQDLCKYLYQADSSFCSILAPYGDWTDSQVYNDLIKDDSQIGAAFKKLDDQNHEKLLSLEVQCAEEGYAAIMANKGSSWILERSSGLIGSYYSLLAWAPYADNPSWEEAFDQSKTDKQMLLDLMYNACQHGSTAGKLNHRWHSQCRLGVDMIEGTLSEEQIIEWIELNDESEIYDIYKYGANGAADDHGSYGSGDYIYEERGG